MLALFAAAAVAAVPVASKPSPGALRAIAEQRAPTAQVATAMPNLYRPPAHCADARQRVVDKDGRPVLLPLGSLPTASLQLTVDRRIDGCPVITVAQGWALPAADQPNPPPAQYRLQPLHPERP